MFGIPMVPFTVTLFALLAIAAIIYAVCGDAIREDQRLFPADAEALGDGHMSHSMIYIRRFYRLAYWVMLLCGILLAVAIIRWLLGY